MQANLYKRLTINFKSLTITTNGLPSIRMAFDCLQICCKYDFLTNIRSMFLIFASPRECLRTPQECLRTPTIFLRSFQIGAESHSLARSQAYSPRCESRIRSMFLIFTHPKNVYEHVRTSCDHCELARNCIRKPFRKHIFLGVRAAL